jgi:hypothetical protein
MRGWQDYCRTFDPGYAGNAETAWRDSGLNGKGENMPHEIQVLAFDFKYTVNMVNTVNKEEKSDENAPRLTDDQVITTLNRNSESISHQIAKEIGNLLPPSITVRSIVRFQTSNSFLIEGMVLLSSWVAPIALRVGKQILSSGEKSLTDNLNSVIKIGLETVFQRFLNGDQKPSDWKDTTFNFNQNHLTSMQEEPSPSPPSVVEAPVQLANPQASLPAAIRIEGPIKLELNSLVTTAEDKPSKIMRYVMITNIILTSLLLLSIIIAIVLAAIKK